MFAILGRIAFNFLYIKLGDLKRKMKSRVNLILRHNFVLAKYPDFLNKEKFSLFIYLRAF